MNDNEEPGCIGAILQALGLSPKDAGEEIYPYHLRDDFLSAVELNFYRVLQTAVGDWAVICPKVSLGDLFYAKSGDHKANVGLRNRIDRKHMDFLLCDPRSMRPLVGIELDDASHHRPSRQDRDRLVDKVFDAAGLPLLREPARASYSPRQLEVALKELAGAVSPEPISHQTPDSPAAVEAGEPAENQLDTTSQGNDGSSSPLQATSTPPACPKCGEPMVLRVAGRGSHQGERFWGCPSYPRCHGKRAYLPEKKNEES
jgi:hypothetical protein